MLLVRIAFFFICFGPFGNGQRQQAPRLRQRIQRPFTDEIDSFFDSIPFRPVPGDNSALASIRAPDQVVHRPSPFPLLLSPRVIIKNKGQPPPNEPEVENSPALEKHSRTTSTNRENKSRQTVVQRLDLKTKSQTLSPEKTRTLDQSGVAFPFSIEPDRQERPLDNIPNFPNAAPDLFPFPGKTNRKEEAHIQLSTLNDSPRRNQNSELLFQQELPIQGEPNLFNLNNNPQIRFPQTIIRQKNVENTTLAHLKQQVPSRVWKVAPLTPDVQDDRIRSFNFAAPTTMAASFRTPSLIDQRNFKPSTNGSVLFPVRPRARPFVITPTKNKTQTALMNEDLDNFFSSLPSGVQSPTIKPDKTSEVSFRTTLKRKTTQATSNLKNRVEAVLPEPKRQQFPILAVAQLQDPLDSLREENTDEKMEDDENFQTERVSKFKSNAGLNFQFVDSSTLISKSTTSRPQSVLKSSTPQVRTVIHPPPSVVNNKNSQRLITTSVLPRTRAHQKLSPRPASLFSSQSRRPTSTFLETDPTQVFIDVPRLALKSRFTTSASNIFQRRPVAVKVTQERKEEESHLKTPSSVVARQRSNENFRNNFFSNRKSQQVIFRDDVSPPNKDDHTKDMELMQSHTFLKSSAENDEIDKNDEPEEINTVNSVVKSPMHSTVSISNNRRDQKRFHSFHSTTDSSANENNNWTPVLLQQQFSRNRDERKNFQNHQQPSSGLSMVNGNLGRTRNNKESQISFERSSPKGLIDNREELDYSNFQSQETEGESSPTKPFGPRFTRPHGRIRHPTVDETSFQDQSVSREEEEVFDPDSYEAEYYDEEYDELPLPETTTSRPMRRPSIRTRIPTVFKPVVTSAHIPRKPTGVTRPAYALTSQKTTKVPTTARSPVSSQKVSRNKSSGTKNVKKKCDRSVCRLPYCHCGGTENPGGFSASETPQMILLTFDDAVNDLNWPLYQTLFFSDKTNPNGCPILTTLYVSHEWTDYGKVEAMYAAGHEIASHSISHGDGAGFSKKKWHDEIYGQKEILSRYGGVKADDIRGMRAPFLAIGGNKMFGMLHEDNFTYDSSITILENNPPAWPYTFDYGMPHECAIPPCPTNSFPGLWEIPMVSLTDANGGRCSMADSCSYSTTSEGVYNMLVSNFKRHYETNRAPMGLYYHSSWFLTPHRKVGFLQFLDEILQMDDVYLVTSTQLLDWMKNPTPLSRIQNFAPWQCSKNTRQPACRISRQCNISFRGDMRPFRTCGECPIIYPWVGKTNV